jgi:type III secretion protein J
MINRIRYLSIVLLCSLIFGCGGRVELLNDISEAEANEAMASLLNAGISSSKIPGKEGMVSLDVEQSQVAKAIAILHAEGLPRERFAKMGDVFRKEGLISSPLEERVRYIWALSQELSATLAQIDGVIKARVHVVLPEKAGGGEPMTPSSAAVFIKHKPEILLEDAIPQIKRLVSNSIPGLSSEKVTVVMLPSTAKAEGQHQAVTSLAMSIPAPAKKVVAEKQSQLANQKIWMISAGMAIFVILASSVYGIWQYRRRAKVQGNGDLPQASSV